ncbi:serine/threonine-protein kinase 16 isoform X2 [Daktulosphaira vitifoliae]|uniref:serine/threonine-protein kinase 16 isoform X2 n=1 Tax=Daktulosphaira vitifoliae TaxID=58002 RepID=UPI0021AADDBE|nr:serine/threonine-protein kinase 16 isoform X2 [Daktulosphaira vitifoliae]
MGCVCGKQNIILQNNKYYIIDQIGQGGFSSVYLVEDTNNTKYVLKCIYCHDEKDKEKAQKEAEMHSILDNCCKNSYIIKLIGYKMIEKCPIFSKTPKDTFLMLLPFYKNGSLHDRLILYQNQINLKTIIQHFHIICLGVKVFHDVSYAHRDIKPANILFDHNNKPIIIDLGSAAPAKVVITSQKDAQELLDDVNERCSMTYRAPELFNIDLDSVIDERIDVWNFNKIIKMILTTDHVKRPNINDVLEYVTSLEDSLNQDIERDPFV